MSSIINYIENVINTIRTIGTEIIDNSVIPLWTYLNNLLPNIHGFINIILNNNIASTIILLLLILLVLVIIGLVIYFIISIFSYIITIFYISKLLLFAIGFILVILYKILLGINLDDDIQITICMILSAILIIYYIISYIYITYLITDDDQCIQNEYSNISNNLLQLFIVISLILIIICITIFTYNIDVINDMSFITFIILLLIIGLFIFFVLGAIYRRVDKFNNDCITNNKLINDSKFFKILHKYLYYTSNHFIFGILFIILAIIIINIF
jgi:hypothetical protein